MPFCLSPLTVGGYVDQSELAEAVKEVVKCMSSRAVRPSSLRLTLRMLELERVHAVLSYQCLSSIADRKALNFMHYSFTNGVS